MKRFIKIKHIVVSAALLVASTTHAGSLDKKIDELDQKQKVLERKWELTQESGNGTVSAGKDGFSIKSGDGNFELRLKGLIQADGRFFLQSTPKGTNTLLPRSIRPILEGSFSKRFEFRLAPDFGNGTTTLQDAYFDSKFSPYTVLRFGKFKSPVGLERLQSETSTLFVERALPSQIAPNRDLGVQLSGEIAGGLVSYTAGLFNGVADGASADLDLHDGKEVAGRIFFKPFIKSSTEALKGLGFGAGGSYGTQNNLNQPSTPGVPSYKSVGQQAIFKYKTDTTTPKNNVIAKGTDYRLSPQLTYYVGPFGLLGEYIQSWNNVAIPSSGTAAKLSNKAWQVESSFAITGEKASYKGIKVKKTFDPAKGRWGALEVAARYNELRVDPKSFPTFASATSSVKQARAFGGGVNWYLSDNVRITADFEHTTFKGGAAAAGNRGSENVFETRAQLAF